jgi:hypothetical protein
VIGLIGATLAVFSTYGIWFQYSGYTLNGIQLDYLLYENFSYNIYVRVVYVVPVFVFVGVILTLVKPYEHLIVRGLNALSLSIATLTALFPILRILGVQHFSIDTLEHFQYGFWVLVASVGLLFYSWVISLSEVNRSLSKFEILRVRIKVLLSEVKSEIEIPIFAKKCGINEKLLIDIWNRFKDEEFKDFIISNGKIVNRQWLKEILREKLM